MTEKEPAYIYRAPSSAKTFLARLYANDVCIVSPRTDQILTAEWQPMVVAGNKAIAQRISLVFKGKTEAFIDYLYQAKNNSLVGLISNKRVEYDLRSQGISKLLFSMAAEDLKAKNVTSVEGFIKRTNKYALQSRLHAKELFTGNLYQSQVVTQPENYFVTTSLKP